MIWKKQSLDVCHWGFAVHADNLIIQSSYTLAHTLTKHGYIYGDHCIFHALYKINYFIKLDIIYKTHVNCKDYVVVYIINPFLFCIRHLAKRKILLWNDSSEQFFKPPKLSIHLYSNVTYLQYFHSWYWT